MLPQNDKTPTLLYREIELRKWHDLCRFEGFEVVYVAIDRRIEKLQRQLKLLQRDENAGMDAGIKANVLLARIDELERMKQYPETKKKAFLREKDKEE